FFFQAEDGIRDYKVTGVQTCALRSDSGGTCTSDTAGTFIVSAMSGEIVGTATLHVTAAVLARITVTPPFASIALVSSQTFTATRSEERRVGKEWGTRWGGTREKKEI